MLYHAVELVFGCLLAVSVVAPQTSELRLSMTIIVRWTIIVRPSTW